MHDTSTGCAFEIGVEREFDLRFALGVGLVKVEPASFFLVDLGWRADVAEQMRAEGSVNIAAHRTGRDIDPGEAHIVLGKTCHGIEIHFLDVGVRHLGVVAEMEPQLIGVVVAGQPELGEARHDRLIDDLDDVGLGFFRHHAAYRCTVVAHWNISVARAVIAHHFWQIEFHRQTGTIARQRDAVAVDDLAPHGGQTHADLRTVPDA